jgi:4-amino-4-deoxy-L-arabinose transferase-like glycosyltransferase
MFVQSRSEPAVFTARGSFIALACCAILLPLWTMTLFGRGLWTPDEPREADISWRMSIQPARAIPQLAGQPFLEKPPLAYWAAAAAESLLPAHDSALRAPNLLYAAVSLGAIVLLAYELGGAVVAWFAGLASASFLLALQVTSWLATDAAMMAGVTVAMLGFHAGLNAPGRRAKLVWYALMHSGLAWAFMAKGPAGWLVPGLAAVGFIAFERRWRELLRWELWVGALIPACVIGAWLVAVARSFEGTRALSVLLWSNVAGRAVALHSTDAASYATGHRNWPGKYLVELPLYLLPWTFLFVAALKCAWSAARGPDGAPWRLALCALILPLLVLSVAATARGIYAAPLLPAAALLIGLWATQRVFDPDSFDRRMIKATLWLVAFVTFALFVATALIASADAAALRFWPVAAAGAIATLLALRFAFRELRREAWPRGIAATFAAFVLTLLTAGAAVFPAMDGWQDLGSLAREIDHDVGTRSLAAYAPDETIVAVLDRTLAHRPRDFARPANISAARALLDAKDPPLFLVRLPGMGAGSVLERLKSLGVKLRPPRDAAALNDLTTGLGLVVEHVYELPQGRRYALLSRPAAEPALLGDSGT